ncbi:hypothetical protein D9619_010058 [Psilocybe cf. subviscida]|uniref:F-box domain-containing protein n=1 Tax=Psilocybe cf. subviscida TaxID=2480587 RepID=A0A8H5BKW9_9AGAR|nr:hypothetical protein D9619_010058 [Psilocybe cf. subviscida]
MSGISPKEIRKLVDELIVKLDAHSSFSGSNTRKITHEHERASNITTKDILALQLLKTLCNRYAPISQLPNETLIEIFTKADHPDGIGQTCKHWRLLAVGTPALWTRLPTHHHDLALRFLERSKKAPLDVYISKRTAFTTASAILKNIHRIQRLHVTQSSRYLTGIPEVHRIAPHLEDLSIEAWWDGAETFIFSPDAFGVTTALCKLELNNVCLDWCILEFPALTHLSLHDVKVTHDVTGTEFTTTLRGMPLLQDLSMSFGDIELRDYSTATLFEPLHLPQLTDLDIRPRSHRNHIDHFLTHATLPRLRTLHVDYGNDPVDHSPMVRTLASAIQNGDAHPLESLSITSESITITSLPYSLDDGSYIEILLPSVTQEDFDTDDFTMATHILSCTTPTGSEDFSPLVRLAMGSLDLTGDELQQLFGSLPHLEHAEFSWKLAGSFIEALSIPLDHRPDSPIPFPRLNSVEWYGHGFRDSSYPDPELFHALIDCLMQRCEYGVPIHDLVLKCCKLAADPIEAKLLKEIVVNVRVTSGYW